VFGSPAPGSTWPHAAVGPSGIPLIVHDRSCELRPILSWGSVLLHGCHQKSCQPFRAGSSPGVLVPSTFSETSAHGFSEEAAHDFHRGIPPANPTLPTTVPRTGFLNLSATCCAHNPSAFFRQITLLGFQPSGVYPSDLAMGGSSPSMIPSRRWLPR